MLERQCHSYADAALYVHAHVERDNNNTHKEIIHTTTIVVIIVDTHNNITQCVRGSV